jgi:hypothetical protein
MTTLERLQASAVRVGGPDAPQRLQQKIVDAAYPISLHALADLLIARVDTSHAPDAVLDAVTGILLRPNVPLMVPDAILGMAGIAMAELKMRDEVRAIAASLERELGAGRPLTETSAFTAALSAPTFELWQALLAATRAVGLADLLACAARPKSGPARMQAMSLLIDRLRDRRAPLPPEDVAKIGLLLRDAFTSTPPWLPDDRLDAWVLADRAGAEADVRRRFDATGDYRDRLLYHLDRAPRDKAAKAAWHDLVHHLVATLIERGVRIEMNLQAAWRHRPASARERYLTSLDLSRLTEPARGFVVTMLEASHSAPARRILTALAAGDGWPAARAARALERGAGRERRAREERDARQWRETGSAESLKRLYFDHLQYLPDRARFDRWMALLGAEGVREAYGFRPRDAEAPYLYVEVDAKGRLTGISFKE